MKKNILLLLACINVATANAESNVNQLLVKYCGEENHNTSQSVTIEQVTAIGYHRNGYLQIEQPVDDNELKLELAKHTKKVGIDSQCMEYLDAMKLLSMSTSTDKELIARVYFDFDRYSLTSASINILDKIVTRLKISPDMIELVGHTDSIGNSKYNRSLGMKRATTTKQYLVEYGIAADHLNLVSKGEEKPLEDNASSEGRKKNRRVEIF
ncbi:Conserved hypothetical outer membrane protein [Moritella viscosa]|uniref:OmpA family protein n=1 Tax=Moritella viscosa TaxID=80854 RepID=UPI00091FC022|nr:OmpA family protein [Moritella viscosa]SGZ02115.1 Conserved hypothetical outer membrane protein [Moritella viscosa]